MKIYTGRGDKGKTSLCSGQRVFKDDLRVEAYGSVDELNSTLGALVASLPEEMEKFCRFLAAIQAELFQAGAVLATNASGRGERPVFGTAPAKALEDAIDSLQARLPPLDSFILPGGHRAAAWAHLARAICRRAERRILTLARNDPDAGSDSSLENLLVYFNRLSDYLFVLARYCNQATGTREPAWQPKK